jgi:uncharacterized protein
MPRLVHFEISADNPTRAKKFYEDVFGWEIKKWEGPMDYWLVMTGPKDQPGIDGGIMKREHPLTGSNDMTSFRCTIDVSSVDEYIDKVKSNGGEVATPKMAVPGVGWMAFCKDTEGNIFGIMQEDKEAK